jgi:hypothetical protein
MTLSEIGPAPGAARGSSTTSPALCCLDNPSPHGGPVFFFCPLLPRHLVDFRTTLPHTHAPPVSPECLWKPIRGGAAFYLTSQEKNCE